MKPPPAGPRANHWRALAHSHHNGGLSGQTSPRCPTCHAPIMPHDAGRCAYCDQDQASLLTGVFVLLLLAVIGVLGWVAVILTIKVLVRMFG